MVDPQGRVVAVVGATGLQGGAVTRRLLADGWRVRALTRDPGHEKARAVAALGAEVVRADTDDRASLAAAFDGAYGVFNVQNHHISGYDGEVRQARNVTDVALEGGVTHVVYGSAGVGRQRTGVGSWDTKVEVAEYMDRRGLPVTILRPMAFMELMTAPKFFPAASTWHVMPRLMGAARPVGWLAVDDLAAVAATTFADPQRFLGRDVPLTADVRTMAECREAWREARGRGPRRLPMPTWLFERFVGTDETTMWRWLRAHEIPLDTQPLRDILPEALDVPAWLRRAQAPAGAATEPPRSAEGSL